jgi:hypothetical protein
MKKIATLALLALASSAFAQRVTEADFAGYYVGAQLGANQSSSSANEDFKKSSIYPALVLGHNTAFEGMLYGVEAFADFHKKAATGRDFGLAFKAGKVIGDVLVYGRVGITGEHPSYRPQMGLVAEYKLNKNVALTGALTRDTTTDFDVKRTNTNLALGVNYYLR